MDNDHNNEQEYYSNNNARDIIQYIITAHLSNKFLLYLLIAGNSFLFDKSGKAQHFLFDCYMETVFKNIVPDIRAAKFLIAGKSQFKVLQLEIPLIKLHITYANNSIICFRSGTLLSSISTVHVDTLVGIVNINVLDISILFFP